MENLSGKRFGRLMVIHFSHKDKHGNIYWLCKCDCGSVIPVRAGNLKSGHTISCGCYARESAARREFKHGYCSHTKRTPTYQSWTNMRQRCNNPNAPGYEYYGGRGIRVCERWNKSFEEFLLDMGDRPVGATIDRIDPNGDYEPSNCRWSTNDEQANNKRSNHCLSFNGKNQTVSQWAKEKGILPNTLLFRIRRGWPIEKALSNL